MKTFFGVIGKILSSILFAFVELWSSVQLTLFLGFSDCGFGMALPTFLSCGFLNSLAFLLWCACWSMKVLSSALSRRLGRRGSTHGRPQWATLLLWLCVCMILSQSLSICTYFWKGACVGCSFNSTICHFRVVIVKINSRSVGKNEAKINFSCLHISW